jgi:hypothetical protein
MGPVVVAVIGLILATFLQIPSGERMIAETGILDRINRILQD